MALFEKTERDSFDEATLARIARQNTAFNKPKFNYSGLSLIPLAIIAFLVLKK